MATRKPNNMFADVSLPFAALQRLAPPVRLLSAAFWKVMKQRDVAQYGVLEEFVSSTCEMVSGLLTLRHQVKLTLGLRSRLILELLRTPQPDARVIKTHLRRIYAASTPSTSSAPTVKMDVKVEKSVANFHTLVHELLTDPAAKEEFFQEEFPHDYGPLFDQALEKLLWEFLIRLDQLLPVPSLSQTVSWLSETPAVLEECARAATQPQLLKILLDHQTCLGHLEPAASLPPNMGDSILASLSLPLSGKASSNPQQDPAASSSGDQPARRQEKTPAVAIGPITDDTPAVKKAEQDGGRMTRLSATRSRHAKRKQADGVEEETPTSKNPCPLTAACLRRRARVVIRKLPRSELLRAGTTSNGPGRCRPQTALRMEVRSLDNKE
ncbi:TERF1-interacting nuclear factor 2 isoform X1 [Phycodurus eques]|uniref:TERF1-interacting nuclear factor 2 isoform X1 n=1 Tax=Phycodurus eques TaxID=693459 RepID=UPI002ACD78A3|nr:TERF1-interacting nuclear factor 2 isoform X1 [Phycodurus eques]